ncbi:MAG TPA: hypothetical protein VIC31_09530 [Rudaea sp.]
MTGTTINQNGIQPSSGSRPRSGGNNRHATAPAASQIQRRFSMSCVRVAGFDAVVMVVLHRCDGCILILADLTD